MTENIKPEILDQGTTPSQEKKCISPPLEELVAMIDQQSSQTMSSVNSESDLARRKKAEQEKNMEQHIRFSLGDTLLGINLYNAIEVGQLASLTPLPNLPKWLVGISNIRGEILSIIDLKSFFEWSPSPLKKNNPLIIVHNHKIKVGILADRIVDTQNINLDTELEHLSPDKTHRISASFIKGVVTTQEKPTYVLDINNFLSSPRLVNI